MKNKGIIFDVDGTLWDSTQRIAESHNETLHKEGIDKVITVEQVRGVMGFLTEEIANVFFPEFEYERRMELIHKCFEEECAYLRNHAGDLYEDVEVVLKQLSRYYDLYIVSNCQDGYIEALFSVYHIAKYFKDYVCSGKTGLIKGENIKLIMDRNDVSKAVYIGDTQKDKDACTFAEVPFVYAGYGFGEVDSYDAKVDSFKELEKLFLNENV